MKTNFVPAIIMLVAGLVDCILAIRERLPLFDFTKQLLLVLVIFYIIGCAVMFIDWFIQYIDLCPSTNIRRLLTGIIGGYSLTTLYCMVLKYIIMYLIKIC